MIAGILAFVFMIITKGGSRRAREDLISLADRTTEEQQRIARMGGIASGEARRKRKTLKESMNALLEMKPTAAKDLKKLKEAGFDAEMIDNSVMIVLALQEQAKKGNVKAFETIRDLIGENAPSDEYESDGFIEALKGNAAETFKEAGDFIET